MRPAELASAALPRESVAALPVDVPLVIDLDGTLIRSDLLHESLIRLLVQRPAAVLKVVLALLRHGKAGFKREIAKRVEIDAPMLPYDPSVLSWIAAERETGRKVVLCTASDERLASAVGAHVRLFDEVIASDGVRNLSGRAKADVLTARFGSQFDYAGNSSADLPVWQAARRSIVVAAPARVVAEARRTANVVREIRRPTPDFKTWRHALRLHQWAKNALVLLPLFGAHRFTDLDGLRAVGWAFLAFGFCASSVYLVNDLIDLESDRRHPRKRFRPFAAGKISAVHGVAASAALFVAAFVTAAMFVNVAFVGWLAVYLGLTVCYTFWLKRKMLVDSLVLAGLYTLRILAGGAAASIEAGFWLLAFSMFLFFSLAMVKRYSELDITIKSGQESVPGRGYVHEDLPLVQSFGIASAFAAVIVLALYNNGDTVARLYPHEQVVWLTVPILLYWICRMWFLANRGLMHDDPVIFAMRDWRSQVTVGAFFAVLLVASTSW